MQETRVQPLEEDPPEEEMATYSSILAWEIPWTEETGELQSMGLQRVGYNRATDFHSLPHPFTYWKQEMETNLRH